MLHQDYANDKNIFWHRKTSLWDLISYFLIFGEIFLCYFLTFRSLTDHQRLLQSAKWFQRSYADVDYIKGTGNYNKFRRGRLDGYLVIHNITYAEAGKYECIVHTAVGNIIGMVSNKIL